MKIKDMTFTLISSKCLACGIETKVDGNKWDDFVDSIQNHQCPAKESSNDN